MSTYHDLGHDTVVLGLDVNGGLVSFLEKIQVNQSQPSKTSTYNFQQDIARGKLLALLLLPGRDTTLCHRRAHCGHVEHRQRGPTRRCMEV